VKDVRGKVVKAQILRVGIFDHATLAWEAVGTDGVRVNVRFLTAPTDPVPVLFRLEGE
jgi:hypothetical protein